MSECGDKQKTHRRIGETEEGWGSGRLRKPPVHHTGTRRSCSSYMKVLLAKKIKFIFLLHPLCLFSISLSISFSLFTISSMSHIHLYTLPRCISSCFLSPSLHFSLSPSLSLSLLRPSLSFAMQHLSGRELGPSLGCCLPGLLAAK